MGITGWIDHNPQSPAKAGFELGLILNHALKDVAIYPSPYPRPFFDIPIWNLKDSSSNICKLQIPLDELRHHRIPVFDLGRVCDAVAGCGVEH